MAARADDTVDIYRLESQVNKSLACKGDDFYFNFTILPDQFPDDISWFLQGSDRIRIIGGILPHDKTNQPSTRPLVYSRCLENNNTYYTFYIQDNYGDGVCCDWGDGSFTVKWNNEQVLNHDGFQSNKVICLPQSDNLIPLIVKIRNFRRKMRFLLPDSNSIILMKGMGSSHEAENELFSQCLTRNECLKFRTMNQNGAAVWLSITHIIILMYETFVNNILETVEIGDCNISSCPQNHTLFELEIITNNHPDQF